MRACRRRPQRRNVPEDAGKGACVEAIFLDGRKGDA